MRRGVSQLEFAMAQAAIVDAVSFVLSVCVQHSGSDVSYIRGHDSVLYFRFLSMFEVCACA